MIATNSVIPIQLSCSKYICTLLVCEFLVVEQLQSVTDITSPASILYSR